MDNHKNPLGTGERWIVQTSPLQLTSCLTKVAASPSILVHSGASRRQKPHDRRGLSPEGTFETSTRFSEKQGTHYTKDTGVAWHTCKESQIVRSIIVELKVYTRCKVELQQLYRQREEKHGGTVREWITVVTGPGAMTPRTVAQSTWRKPPRANCGQTEAVIATRRITSTLGQQPGKHKSAQRDQVEEHASNSRGTEERFAKAVTIYLMSLQRQPRALPTQPLPQASHQPRGPFSTPTATPRSDLADCPAMIPVPACAIPCSSR
jgi:hypothetical protein